MAQGERTQLLIEDSDDKALIGVVFESASQLGRYIGKTHKHIIDHIKSGKPLKVNGIIIKIRPLPKEDKPAPNPVFTKKGKTIYVCESYYAKGSKAYYKFNSEAVAVATLLELNGVHVKLNDNNAIDHKGTEFQTYLHNERRCRETYDTDSIQLDRYGKVWLQCDTIEEVDEWFESHREAINAGRVEASRERTARVKSMYGRYYKQELQYMQPLDTIKQESVKVNPIAKRGTFSMYLTKKTNLFEDNGLDMDYLKDHENDYQDFKENNPSTPYEEKHFETFSELLHYKYGE